MFKQLIETLNREVTINGKAHDVLVSVYAAEDNDQIVGSFDFGNEKDNAEYLSRFKSGELESIGIIVEAEVGFDAPKGHDSLWACHVKSGSKQDILDLVADHGMVDIAIKDLTSGLEMILKSFA